MMSKEDYRKDKLKSARKELKDLRDRIDQTFYHIDYLENLTEEMEKRENELIEMIARLKSKGKNV